MDIAKRVMASAERVEMLTKQPNVDNVNLKMSSAVLATEILGFIRKLSQDAEGSILITDKGDQVCVDSVLSYEKQLVMLADSIMGVVRGHNGIEIHIKNLEKALREVIKDAEK